MTTKLPSKKQIEATMIELQQIAVNRKKLKEREDLLRHAIADNLHKGENGIKNFEIAGFEIKVGRKMNITCSKLELARLEDEDEELFDAVTDTKVTINSSKAARNIDQLDDYVTLKQGLPTVTITAIK